MMHLYNVYCVLLYILSALQSCGGGGGLSSITTSAQGSVLNHSFKHHATNIRKGHLTVLNYENENLSNWRAIDRKRTVTGRLFVFFQVKASEKF